MLKQYILDWTRSEVLTLLNQESIRHAEQEAAINRLYVEVPKNTEFGDYAVNISSLSKLFKKSPPQIASIFIETHKQTPNAWFNLTAAGGYINFKVSQTGLIIILEQLLNPDFQPGKNASLKDWACLLEFVSANPTGPLHIGHGRWVALGDSIARILEHCGATVTREFYMNDAGSQINNLAMSVWYRCLELKNTGIQFPTPVEGEKFPYYPGEYIKEIAKDFLSSHSTSIEDWLNTANLEKPPQDAIDSIKLFAIQNVVKEQQALMKQCGLVFDNWFSEQTLYKDKLVEATIERLKTSGITYEHDGALWLKTTAYEQYGDDQDRVLQKQDGSYTYLTPDLAYHHNKYQRSNPQYNCIMNIWGADHHGYIPRIKAGITALGHDAEKLEIILGQLVNLMVDGEKTRMGKRRKMVTLGELVDEVGVDPVRFWMVSKSADTTLDFDVELATSQTHENPVFYVQYAHARCASIIRNAFLETLPNDTEAAKNWQVLTEANWKNYLETLKPENLNTLWKTLDTPEAQNACREILLRLDNFEDKILEAARIRAPHIIARYTMDLAATFHHFYNVCRILTPDVETRKSRLTIITALKKTLAQALLLLGVSAPESM